jgi:hypothetical protein
LSKGLGGRPIFAGYSWKTHPFKRQRSQVEKVCRKTLFVNYSTAQYIHRKHQVLLRVRVKHSEQRMTLNYGPKKIAMISCTITPIVNLFKLKNLWAIALTKVRRLTARVLEHIIRMVWQNKQPKL